MRDKLYGIFYPEANLFDEFLEILIKGAEGLYVFEAFHGGVTAFAYKLAKVVETLQEGSGYVYVIKNGFTYKIGITQNMKKRMQSYRKTENAFPYKIVFCHRVAKYKEVEKLLHRKFEHQKIGTGREWFKLSDDDLSKIEKTLMLYSVQ